MRAMIAFLLVALNAVSSFAADDWQNWETVNAWRIDQNGNMCLTSAIYNNGIRLGFSITRGGEFYLSFWKEEWNIPSGNYEIYTQIDNGKLTKLNANGDGNLISIALILNDTTSNLLRFGNQLHVTMGRINAFFNLTSTNRMLSSLYRCAFSLASTPAPNGAKETEVSNPFAGQRNPFE